MNEVKEQIEFSECSIDDLPFIFDSWVQSNWNEQKGKMPRGIYRKFQKQVISALMGKSKCIVAHNIHDQDQIFGYVVFEPDALHYVYVKSPFRNNGIGKMLMEQTEEQGLVPGFECSHNSPSLRYLIRDHTYNFFRVFYASEVC